MYVVKEREVSLLLKIWLQVQEFLYYWRRKRLRQGRNRRYVSHSKAHQLLKEKQIYQQKYEQRNHQVRFLA